MSVVIPRLRMFAGPNGSGKSTFEAAVPAELIGIYLNPDNLEKKANENGTVDFEEFGIKSDAMEFAAFLDQSLLLKREKLNDAVFSISVEENVLRLNGQRINSYLASVISHFIREKLLEVRKSFTFETVMSSVDKIHFLKKAQECGYRTYLYYVATEDPRINIARVKHRVLMGGHSVPEEKIVSRYRRSLGLLSEAIRASNRAYVFDNSISHSATTLIAEFTDGVLQKSPRKLPEWIKPVLDEF